MTAPASTARPVSVVIPSWNGREILARNLPSVKTAVESYAGGGEVIVVDDGSRDGTVPWLAEEHPWVRTVARSDNEGFGSSVNRGVAAARREVVVLLNNDMRVEPGFLAPLLLPFESERGLFSTTPCIVNRTFGGDEAVTACVFKRGLLEMTFPERDKPPGAGAKAEVLYACGGAAAFDRSLWMALGGLDALYAPFYWEDVDLSWRARKRGWRVVHVPESIVHHEHNATIGARFSPRTVRGIFERNRLLFQWKNLTSRRLTIVHASWLPFRLVWALAGRPDFLRGFFMAAGRIRDAARARRLERALATVRDEDILDRFEGR